MMNDLPITWKMVGAAAAGLLLSVIAWNVGQATQQLREMNQSIFEIKVSLAGTTARIEDHERRLRQIEALFSN